MGFNSGFKGLKTYTLTVFARNQVRFFSKEDNFKACKLKCNTINVHLFNKSHSENPLYQIFHLILDVQTIEEPQIYFRFGRSPIAFIKGHITFLSVVSFTLVICTEQSSGRLTEHGGLQISTFLHYTISTFLHYTISTFLHYNHRHVYIAALLMPCCSPMPLNALKEFSGFRYTKIFSDDPHLILWFITFSTLINGKQFFGKKHIISIFRTKGWYQIYQTERRHNYQQKTFTASHVSDIT